MLSREASFGEPLAGQGATLGCHLRRGGDYRSGASRQWKLDTKRRAASGPFARGQLRR
jgi:hypothetical protein